jgi:IS5 family transposase
VSSSPAKSRSVFGVIKLRRRSAIEPIIGHRKAEGHLGRCYLKGRAGDAANIVLSAIGHNFRRVLAWLRKLLCLFLFPLWRTLAVQSRSIQLLNGRLTKSRITEQQRQAPQTRRDSLFAQKGPGHP